jgi:acyl carrier protein
LGDAKPTEPEICEWCTSYLAKVLELSVSQIDPKADFARLGIDSAISIFFVVDLEEWLGLELPSNIAFEYPSVAELAGYLAKRCADQNKRRTSPGLT